MRNIIGLIVGLYLTVALVVFASAAWTFNTDTRWKNATCTAGASLNWLPWAAYRGITWPKAYMDEQALGPDLINWLAVQYTPAADICS